MKKKSKPEPTVDSDFLLVRLKAVPVSIDDFPIDTPTERDALDDMVDLVLVAYPNLGREKAREMLIAFGG